MGPSNIAAGETNLVITSEGFLMGSTSENNSGSSRPTLGENNSGSSRPTLGENRYVNKKRVEPKYKKNNRVIERKNSIEYGPLPKNKNGYAY